MDSKQPEAQEEDIRRIQQGNELCYFLVKISRYLPRTLIPFFPILTFIYSNNATICFKARVMFCMFSEQLVCKIVHMPVTF